MEPLKNKSIGKTWLQSQWLFDQIRACVVHLLQEPPRGPVAAAGEDPVDKTLSAREKTKIFVEMSTKKPEVADLAQKLDVLTWEEVVSLTVQLRVDFSELKKIEREQNATLRALDIWLATDTEASWKKVVDALRAIKKTVLADEIEREMRSPTTATASQQPIPSSQRQPAPLSFVSSSYSEGDMKPILQQSHSTPAGKLA